MARGFHSHPRRASVLITALPVAAGLLLAGAFAEHASAASVYSFERVEANAPVDSSANYQLTIDSFTDNGDEWVSFRFDHFDNVDEIDTGSIAKIFFQDSGNLFWDGENKKTLEAFFNEDASHEDVSFGNPD